MEFDGWIPKKSSILIGWGTWTHIGAMLAMCLPAPFYFAREASEAIRFGFWQVL